MSSFSLVLLVQWFKYPCLEKEVGALNLRGQLDWGGGLSLRGQLSSDGVSVAAGSSLRVPSSDLDLEKAADLLAKPTSDSRQKPQSPRPS